MRLLTSAISFFTAVTNQPVLSINGGRVIIYTRRNLRATEFQRSKNRDCEAIAATLFLSGSITLQLCTPAELFLDMYDRYSLLQFKPHPCRPESEHSG